MNIPLAPSQNEDIFSLGFDQNLNRAIPDNATGVVYDSINDTQNTASLLSGGNLNLKTLSIGGLVRQVAPGDDIQAAIDAVSREGGGTVQLLAKRYLLLKDLYIKEKVTLAGAGRDQTILDLQGTTASLNAVSPGPYLSNFSVRDLTIQNTTGFGLYILYGDAFVVENVRVLVASHGFVTFTSKNGRFSNCTANSCTTAGFYMNDGGLLAFNLVLINCLAQTNTVGFLYTTSTFLSVTTNGCSALGNTSHGFHQNSTGVTSLNVFTSCISQSNGGWGMLFLGGENVVTGNVAYLNTLGSISATAGINTIVGNFSSVSSTPDVFNTVWGNTFESLTDTSRLSVGQNTSGGSVPVGAVVTFGAVASGSGLTTTTTNGSNRVTGMSLSAANASTSMSILREGYTQNLLAVNGTTSLAIGDFLSTYSHAYYAKKAIAGDTAFAICLEAPITGTAIIDALLISPRLI